MALSRRDLGIRAAGAGLLALAPAWAGRAAVPEDDLRILVELRLEGGHDGWNMAVPTGPLFEAYRQGRGRRLALPLDALQPLDGSGLGLHPGLAALETSWRRGRLALLVNTGPLTQAADAALLRRRPDLLPPGLMLHHAQGADGMLERLAAAVAGAALHRADAAAPLRAQLAGVVAAATAAAAAGGRGPLAFRVFQPGHDTHAGQAERGNPAAGRQSMLLAELAAALTAFEAQIEAAGLAERTVLFTASEFGRAYRANSEGGTDHGWGNVQLVLGGGLAARRVHGRYPDPRPGGPDDAGPGDGRWVPGLASERHLAPLASWFGLASARLPDVLPGWRRWSAEPPLPLFAATVA
jgi:uncharacterized protein (DUF1501 family)